MATEGKTKESVYYAGYSNLNRLLRVMLIIAMVLFGGPIMRHPVTISFLILFCAFSIYKLSEPFVILTNESILVSRFLRKKVIVTWVEISSIKKNRRWGMDSLEISTKDGKSIKIGVFEMFESSRNRLIEELLNERVESLFE